MEKHFNEFLCHLRLKVLKNLIDFEGRLHHLQVLIFFDFLSFYLYHYLWWLYYICYSILNSYAVCGLHLWIYYISDELIFNVLYLCSDGCLLLLIICNRCRSIFYCITFQRVCLLENVPPVPIFKLTRFY